MLVALLRIDDVWYSRSPIQKENPEYPDPSLGTFCWESNNYFPLIYGYRKDFRKEKTYILRCVVTPRKY